MTRLPTYDELLTIRFFFQGVDKMGELVPIAPDALLKGKEKKSKILIRELAAEGWIEFVVPDTIPEEYREDFEDVEPEMMPEFVRVTQQTADNIEVIENLVGRMH